MEPSESAKLLEVATMAKFMRSRLTIAGYVLTTLIVLGAMVESVKADAPGCSLTDACTNSEYGWFTHTCFVSTRCWVVDQKWCGTTPSTWMYRQYSTFENYPCENIQCGAGSRCLGYNYPGGGS